MSNVLVVVKYGGVYSPTFQSSLKAIKTHLDSPLQHQELDYEEGPPDFEQVVSFLENGGGVIVDQGQLPSGEVDKIKDLVEERIHSGRLSQEVLGRFIVAGLKIK